MKTVSGSVVSSKVVSLSDAARILSKFASSDNGASPAFAAYLKRASTSFNELVQLHKEFKGSGSERKGSKHPCSGIVNEETANSIKKPNEDDWLTEERQGTSERKKHKVGRMGEEAREVKGILKIDDKKPRHKKRGDEGEGSVGTKVEMHNIEGIVDGDASPVGGDLKKLKKKKESDDMIANSLVEADAVKNDIKREDGDRDTKMGKIRDRGQKDNVVGPVKIEKEEQGHPSGQNDSNRIALETKRQNGDEEKKKKKKKKREKVEKVEIHDAVKIEKDKQGNPPGENDLTRKTSKIERRDGGIETKKKRDETVDGQRGGYAQFEMEEQGCPGQNDGNGEITEFVGSVDSKKEKNKKTKKKGKEEKEGGAVGNAVQRIQSYGIDRNVQEVRSSTSVVNIESGGGKKYKTKRNHGENEGEIDMGEANEKESRKRKHKGDANGRIDDSEEQHRLKKKKRKTEST